ncbi:MAG: SPASM domain-containing protein [Candidatus Latescibacteria bacterium]|nr:SPASM domain-containing protein [Candidatus Latescibacterota bacterium]
MSSAFLHSLRRATPFLTDPASWANLVRIASSYVRSMHSGHAVVSGLPVVLMIEPTNLCNLRCPLCPSGDGRLTRARGMMDRATFDRILKQTQGAVKLLQLWNQGEPLLHPDLPWMIRRAKAQGMFVSMSTNGHPLADPSTARKIVHSGLDHLIVSVDGATQETYARYRRGGNLQTVLKGIEHCVEAGMTAGERGGAIRNPQSAIRNPKRPWIELQFIVMRHNEHEIPAMKALARQLGVDRLSLKTVQIDAADQSERFLPSDRKQSRYAAQERKSIPEAHGNTGEKPTDLPWDSVGFRDKVWEDGTLMTERKRDTCRRLWFSTVINWDGSVVPCCFDKDGDFVMGNLLQESLEHIWRGRRYRAFRNAVLRNRVGIAMCRNCTEGLRKLFLR